MTKITNQLVWMHYFQQQNILQGNLIHFHVHFSLIVNPASVSSPTINIMLNNIILTCSRHATNTERQRDTNSDIQVSCNVHYQNLSNQIREAELAPVQI